VKELEKKEEKEVIGKEKGKGEIFEKNKKR